jgi:hypothetical protein
MLAKNHVTVQHKRCEISGMMMEAARTSETSVDNYFTRQYIPEDNPELHSRRRENFKSGMMEAARTSETSVDNYFTRQYIPEDNSEQHKRCLFTVNFYGSY